MSAEPDPTVAASPPVRVPIVDDHPIWREGTARYLAEAGCTIAGTAGDGAQALRITAATRPDVVLLDLNLPDLNGAEVTRTLLTAHPSVRVLMLSASGGRQDVLDAVTARAVGYVLKSVQLTELVAAVRSAAVGQPVFTPELAGLVLGEYRRLANAGSASSPVMSGDRIPGGAAADAAADRPGNRGPPAGRQGADLSADRRASDAIDTYRAKSRP